MRDQGLYRWCVVALLVSISFVSASDALAANTEEGEGGWGTLEPVGRIVNILVLLAVLVYFLRKPLGQAFKNRSEEIKKSLIEAREARDRTQAKLAEMERKMQSLDDELRQLKATAEREAAEERARIIESAREDAEKIVALARREIDGLTRSARKELKAYAAELSVGLAEERIKKEINGEDEQKLFEKFVENIKGVK